MGRFLTVDDLPPTEKYPYNNPIPLCWYIGSLEDNFPHRYKWYEQDGIDYSRETSTVPRVEVRRWCERNLDGDVYVMSQSKSMYRYYNKEDTFGGGYQIHANWIEFCFEFETDLVAFKLRWL